MDVETEHVEPSRERVGDEGLGLRGLEAELRAVMPRDDCLVRVRVDAERHAHEDALDARGRRELGLVRRIEDDRSTLLRGLPQERRVLVVAVHDELVARQARGAGEGELARGSDVRADSLLA